MGFGFRVSGFGFRVSGFGFRVLGLSFGFRVRVLVLGFRFWVQVCVLGFVFWVSGLGLECRAIDRWMSLFLSHLMMNLASLYLSMGIELASYL